MNRPDICVMYPLQTRAQLQLPGLSAGGYTKVRVPYPPTALHGEVTERKQLKEVLVEMTQTATAGKK